MGNLFLCSLPFVSSPGRWGLSSSAGDQEVMLLKLVPWHRCIPVPTPTPTLHTYSFGSCKTSPRTMMTRLPDPGGRACGRAPPEGTQEMTERRGPGGNLTERVGRAIGPEELPLAVLGAREHRQVNPSAPAARRKQLCSAGYTPTAGRPPVLCSPGLPISSPAPCAMSPNAVLQMEWLIPWSALPTSL